MSAAAWEDEQAARKAARESLSRMLQQSPAIASEWIIGAFSSYLSLDDLAREVESLSRIVDATIPLPDEQKGDR